MKTVQKLFCWSAIVLLLLTAAAKLISAGGGAPILDLPDPLFGLANRQLLVLVGLLELGVVAGLLSPLEARGKYLCLAWLASNFLVYRIALALINPGKACPCLGTITQRLQISDRAAGIVLSWIVVYLLAGSLWLFVRDQRERGSAA